MVFFKIFVSLKFILQVIFKKKINQVLWKVVTIYTFFFLNVSERLSYRADDV